MGHDLNFNLLYKILLSVRVRTLLFSRTRLPLVQPSQTNRSVAQQTQLCRFSWNYNGIKKITVWKLVARNEDAFDRVRCLRSNKCHLLALSHTHTDTQKLRKHSQQQHKHTITTYLKGLPRDLTNFFNFLFVRWLRHDSISLLIPFDCHQMRSHLYFCHFVFLFQLLVWLYLIWRVRLQFPPKLILILLH